MASFNFEFPAACSVGWILKYELSLSSTQHSEADVICRSLLWGELINFSQSMTMEPVQFPINDILDLHTFLPREVPDLLDDYFEACVAKGVLSVRVIHGKGQGILRARVLKHLNRHPLVRTIKAAPPEAGGWGATLVELSPSNP